MRTLLALCAAAAAASFTHAEPPPLPDPVAPQAPVLRTTSQRHWVLSMRYRATTDDDFDNTRGGINQRVSGASFDIEQARVVAPALTASALHTALAPPRASLRLDGDTVDREATLLPGYQNAERLARLDAQHADDVETIDLWLDLPMRSRSVAFDESRAMSIGWPDGPWPALCASALQSQLAIDPANEHVRAFVQEVVGAPPHTDPPALIAKKLAAAVINRFQPSGLGFEYDRTGRFAGIDFEYHNTRLPDPFKALLVANESDTAERFVGSPADMTALYVSALRAAGVPARPVVAYDLYSAPEAGDEDLAHLTSVCGERYSEGDNLEFPRLIYYAEFALYDEDANTLEWIPVDVFSQRRISSRAKPIDQPWIFFGSSPCGEARLPISFHFFPPTTVVGMGAPLLWGWVSHPEIPLLTQSLRVWASGAPVTTPGD